MADDLIAFVEDMDRCWMERRFDDLASYLAEDVVLVAPGGKHRMTGRQAAIGSYREFMSRSTVHRFETSNHVVTERGDAAVVEYRWSMAWSDRETGQEATGRDILVLARLQPGWRAIWRTQLAD